MLLKYGKLLQAAFAEPGGQRLKEWIDDCPNQLYSALVFQGGAAWRRQLEEDLAIHPDTLAIVRRHDDAELARLMTNLGGHDLETILEGFAAAPTDQPVCYIAYTIKGFGLPFQGHKDNHAGLMTKAQMQELRAREGINQGEEWDRFAGLSVPPAVLEDYLRKVPFVQRGRRRLQAARIPVTPFPKLETKGQATTQAGFGRMLDEIARAGGPLADRIVTTSPDVTVSTNLGAWVNRRGLFSLADHEDVFKKRGLLSPQKWEMSPKGQHFELGIAEMNLFLMLSALGLSHSLFGERLLPVGTLYDPFVCRGLDALNYACYQDARFIVAGTPVRHHAGAGRRRAPVDRHAADRHGAGWACLLRAGLRRRAGRDHGVGVRLHAARRRRGQGEALAPRREGRLGVPAPVDAAARSAAAQHDARACATRSSTAPTGCAGRSPARASPSSIQVRWRPRRSRRPACCREDRAASACWR